MLSLRMLYFEDLSVGMTETLSKVIDASDVVGFAEVTGDRNPIHLSEHFAAKTPFGTRIAHGLYTASLISAVLGTRLPGPGAVYISQTLNFRAPVKIGDRVDVTVLVAELMPDKFRARLTCTCSVGDDVVLREDVALPHVGVHPDALDRGECRPYVATLIVPRGVVGPRDPLPVQEVGLRPEVEARWDTLDDTL